MLKAGSPEAQQKTEENDLVIKKNDADNLESK